MPKGYVYIVSDGIGDLFKFGFTTEPLARITKYNSTECFRQVKYDSLVEYSTEREARDVEIKIRKSLFDFIKNPTTKPEISKNNKKSRKIYFDIIESSNFKDKNLAELYNSIFTYNIKNLDYEFLVHSIVSKAKLNGVIENKIYDSIIENRVGYKFENASPIVIKEKRRKNLININNIDLYYDTKPKLIERFHRLSMFDHELKTGIIINITKKMKNL